ncbi:MAG TPA: ComF family protein [Polyangiaceae bacterium]|nr:ComF family protein [Polyangiaceae bacterium]
MIHSGLSLVLAVTIEAIAPSRCAACDGPAHRLSAFCVYCASTVEHAPPASCAAFVYAGAVAAAIVRMKYGARPDLARPLGDLLWRSLEGRSDRWRGGLVVPVPMHPARLANRGFSPPALLARRVAPRLEARLAPLALARTRDTPQQTTLDRVARATNVAGAFRVRQPEAVRGRAVLLVDDVTTTGATLDACANVLRAAGAASVGRAAIAAAAHRVVDSPATRETVVSSPQPSWRAR